MKYRLVAIEEVGCTAGLCIASPTSGTCCRIRTGSHPDLNPACGPNLKPQLSYYHDDRTNNAEFVVSSSLV